MNNKRKKNTPEEFHIFVIFFAITAHSTETFRKRCRNIFWKYCKIAKIFLNQSLILFKYCNNLAMSAQNMACKIFSKY